LATMSGKHPEWLKKKAPSSSTLSQMEALLSGLSLHTVCQSALCPNMGECFSLRTATFLIMGDICTRNCRFCAITKGKPYPLDPAEPGNVAQAVKQLELRHVVVTSVTRDDLPDGGADHFSRTIKATRQTNPGTTVEVLIPDFQGSHQALEIVVNGFPEVINHNVETVPRLYPAVRPGADYQRSINLLQTVKSMNGRILTKSGLMLGLGEQYREVVAVLDDLRTAGCDALTIGQYLPPSPEHHPVIRYVTPPEFAGYRSLGEEMGFGYIASGPFVRSSYRAAKMLNALSQKTLSRGLTTTRQSSM